MRAIAEKAQYSRTAVADEALGKSLADDLRHSVSSSIRYTVSEILKARPELGYEPAKK
jgi:hypothetical protein